jgi:signal transduction histidine kinase
MLLDSVPIGGAIWEELEAIKVCGEHMLELATNVLDIGKIEAKKLSLESIPFRPMNELDGVMKIFESLAEQKKIKLVKVVSMDHPARLGDPLRFRQVLFNLVSNAIKFSYEGGLVIVRMWDDGEAVHTEVEDTGAVIPKEHLSALFEVRLLSSYSAASVFSRHTR